MAALEPLATEADLLGYGVDTANETLVGMLLASASSAVRDAAGVPISRTTSVIKMGSEPGQGLKLPGGPVLDVTSVSIDGEPVTDWKLVDGHLWRACGWQPRYGLPRLSEVEFEHGYDPVPADVVHLVCLLVSSAASSIEDGFQSKGNLAYESIDDYRIGYQQGADSSTSVMELPERTRRWLRDRFGDGGVHVVGAFE